MTYMGDKAYWDDKFRTRENKQLEPEQSIIKFSQLFKQGTILDLACGDGRNSVYLTDLGYEVTAVDFSESALKRLQGFAVERNMSIETIQQDLSFPQALKDLTTFDNILVSHYKLKEAQLIEIKKHIKAEGILLITGFGHKQIVDDKLSAEDLIYKDDFLVLKESFELINYEESIDGRGFFSTYVFKKR